MAKLTQKTDSRKYRVRFMAVNYNFTCNLIYRKNSFLIILHLDFDGHDIIGD